MAQSQIWILNAWTHPSKDLSPSFVGDKENSDKESLGSFLITSCGSSVDAQDVSEVVGEDSEDEDPSESCCKLAKLSKLLKCSKDFSFPTIFVLQETLAQKGQLMSIH